MMVNKILKAKQDYFSLHKIFPTVVVLNYDTALMALSREVGGEGVCYYLSGNEIICGMQLVISGKLKNEEVIVGRGDLIEKFKD